METRRMFFSRRNILKGSAASLAAAALGSSSAAFAQQSSAPTIRPLTGKMTYEEVRNRAQKLLMALARQTLSLENIPNLTKIFEIYEKRVDTNEIGRAHV